MCDARAHARLLEATSHLHPCLFKRNGKPLQAWFITASPFHCPSTACQCCRLLSLYFPGSVRRVFLLRTERKHAGLWSGVPGRSLIYSLNSGLAAAGRDGSEVTGWDRVSVIPEAPRRSGSPAGKNSYEENNVSMRMPVKCVMVMRKHVFSFLQT